ncbi:MAG: hypothetical protein ACR2KT_13690 [Methylocella sp.]
MLDVEHMHGMLVVELIDLSSAPFGELGPAHFLDKHLMPQAIGLLNLIPVMIFIFGGYNVNHSHSPGRYSEDAWDSLPQIVSNSVMGILKYPFRAASKSDSKNLFEFDQWERCDGAIGFL